MTHQVVTLIPQTFTTSRLSIDQYGHIRVSTMLHYLTPKSQVARPASSQKLASLCLLKLRSDVSCWQLFFEKRQYLRPMQISQGLNPVPSDCFKWVNHWIHPKYV